MSEELDYQRFYQASALSDSARKAFIQTIWGSSRDFNVFELSSYFDFLERERKGESRVDDPAYSHLCFRHIFRIGSILREKHDESSSRLQDLVQISLPSLSPKPEVLQDVIKLVIRLMFLVRVEFQNPHSQPSPYQLQMQDNESFSYTLGGPQKGPPLRESSAQNVLPLSFNFIDLQRMANLTIEWTDYLNEHLTYQSGTLMLFRHIKVLEYMERSEILAGNFYKLEFLIETRRSIMLFFPLSEYKYSTQDYLDWFQSRGPIEPWKRLLAGHDPNSSMSRYYEDFPIWHGKLLYLLNISNNQGNWNLKRCWYDDRDQTLWWIRWGCITVMFLVIPLWLIKSITSIILAINAVRS
ncbi:hypothetical protein Forpe1208_v011811 [Fusarium oxysporum f. sp. rapae]|uniref:Uncharacterized protein n=1 Tax=Fusarium oxysporum f. sp. rapae TaxID=485398 RepID=A0A8J5TWZ4_FUSOX|nr:hypothetical protein Forpe1208_v016998 [Fusarium oxysporum f. sp. rapae]KAG7409453.1 hypothetical protein Forpe1208_v011811 [Fusarium oxysporum f. sp. rapae]